MKTKKRNHPVFVQILFTAAMILIAITSCDDFSFYTELDGAGGLRISTPGGNLSDMLSIIPEDVVLPIGTSYVFQASGGSEPYIYSLVEGDGSIAEETGLYSAAAIPGNATVAVTDSLGFVKEADITVVSVGEFTAAPASISLYIYNTSTFTALGGVEPYSWSMVSGSGTIDGSSGVYTAPSSAGSDVVRVTDSIGNISDAVISVLTPFSLSPTEIQVTVDNSYTFTAEGGKTPYVFTVDSGGGAVDAVTGEYTAPAAAGNAVLGAVDALGNYDSAEITIVPPAALLISPVSITLNVDDSTTFSATGGTSPYNFAILSGSGNIDAGGTYTAPGATGTDIIRLSDDDGTISDAVVTIVSSGPLSIVPVSVVVEQDALYDFYADGGSPPYIYSVSSGSGIINPASGLFTAPAATGSATVKVTDSLGAWAEANVDIAPAAPTNLLADGTVVNPDTITITWTDNADGEEGFIIERKLGHGVFAVIDTIGFDSVSYPDSGLSPNNIYGYRVKAYWGLLESEYSNESYDLPNS